MRGFRFYSFLMLSFLWSSPVTAETASDLTIQAPKIEAIKLGWGRQGIPIRITNNGEYLKYVSVVGDVRCKGDNYSPKRKVIKNYALFPGDSVNAEAVILIPGNYGEISIELKIYDVIDTLDQLLESQLIQSQAGLIDVPMTEAAAAYIKKDFTLPPLVGRHIDFDNDFARLVPFLIADGKRTKEIAEALGCDTSFVIEELGYLVSEGYYRKDGDIYLSSVAAISEDEAAEEKKLGLKVAESVAAKLAKNVQTYRQVIDSLVKAEMLDSDSNSFMDGGTILYRPYPVITALSLWYDLGGTFVSNGTPLYLFDGTDFCNAYTPNYMYVVSGDKANNGHQHFAFMRNYRSYQFYYGDTIPNIICPEGFMFNPQEGIRVMPEYEQPFYPEGFMVDTAQVRPMLDHLRRGMAPILHNALEELNKLGQKHGKSEVLLGQRYWFWNIVSTRVIEILTENGTIKKRGNGQFRLDGMSAK